MDDFCIPSTPFTARSADPFDPCDGAASVDITGLGLSTSLNSRYPQGQQSMRPRALDVDTASSVLAIDRRPPAPSKASPTTKPNPCGEGPSPMTYFSALTQRCSRQGHSTQIRPVSAITAKTTPRHSGVAGQHVGHLHSQPRDDDVPARASQPGSGDAGYRGIQDAIATKFQDLEKQIKAQEHEITELRFALNDAGVAADTLETEKRQLKQKAEDLERKLKKSGDKTNKLQEDAQKQQDALREALKNAADEQSRLQVEVSRGQERAKHDERALSDARTAIKELQAQLENTLKEQRELMHATVDQHRRDVEASNKTIGDLTSQLQLREAELQTQRDASTQLTKKMDDIPERNFQALTTCVVKILETVNNAKSEILAGEKASRHQWQDQHGAMVQYLEGLLVSSQKHLETLVSSREEGKQLAEQVLAAVQTSDGERKGAESSCQAQLEKTANCLQARLDDQQASLLDAFAKKCRESDVLASVCDKHETTSRDLTKRLDEQLRISREQNHHFQTVLCALQKLQESPREDASMVAKIQLFQEKKARLESDIKDRDAQIASLEEAYKERTVAILEGAAKYAQDIQQLSSSFRQREEEYRRSLDRAVDLANKEAKRSLDQARADAQNELQQERAKRQALEKDLRQSKEDHSVLEESSRRAQQSHEALQKELTSTKLGNQAVTEHLEDRARALEAQLGRDAALMTKLKAALADKEMDYTNLRSSIEAYNGKVHVLVEHLRGWAQDYIHIGAIRSRLEMLAQIDQSCAATARIREAEQIDSVLALLRQCNAHQHGLEEQHEFDKGEGHLALGLRDCDGAHNQQVSDLAAMLDTEVANYDTHPTVLPPLCDGGTSLKTPANEARRHSSSIRPPPVLNDRTVVVTLGPDSGLAPSSPIAVSSPVPRRPRQGRRATAGKGKQAASHDAGSPLHARPLRKPEPRTKRRRMETSAYFEHEYQGYTEVEGAVADSDGAAADDITTSPPPFIKIEGI